MNSGLGDDSESRKRADADEDTGSIVESLSPQEERALSQLQDALDCLVSNVSRKDCAEDIDCRAYLMACEKSADILTKPSFRLPFLRRSNNDPWLAAKRMVAYWTERKFLFDEAAFEPLTICSLPALFQEASIVLLPHRDKEDRSVIFLNRLKLNDEQLRDHKGRAQCMFYILDLVAQQNPTASTKGIVVLALVCKPPMDNKTIPQSKGLSWWDSFFHSFSSLYEWKFPQHCVRMATHGLPVQVAMIHICTLPQTCGEGYLRTATVNVCLNMLGSFFKNITKVHHGSKAVETQEGGSDEEIVEHEPGILDQYSSVHRANLLRQLRAYGLFKRQLPEALGGLFKMQNFEHWVNRRTNQELRARATEEELRQLKRSVNLVHSRQKRLRRRQEEDEMNSLAERLKTENERAKIETERLEARLEQAAEMVKRIERDGPASYGSSQPTPSVYKSSPVAMPIDSSTLAFNQDYYSLHSPAQPMPDLSATPGASLYAQGDAAPILQQPSEPAAYGLYTSSHGSGHLGQPDLRGQCSMSDFPMRSALTSLHGEDSNIPSAADLCQGFSDDDDDRAFKNQLQKVADPQPSSIWSSMVGLFRPQAVSSGGGAVDVGCMAQSSAATFHSTLPLHEQNQEQNHPSPRRSFDSPSTFHHSSPFDSAGWQLTTTTTISPLYPRGSLKNDLSDPAFASRSQLPPTERSSPYCDPALLHTTSSTLTEVAHSPTYDEWYSW